MPKFTYDDMVKTSDGVGPELRPGKKAWVIGVFETRPGKYFDKFPEGVVYSIEFEDGTSVDVHESELEKFGNM